MWSKLYLAILGLSTAVMAFFTYYSWSWLQSIGSPAAAVEGFVFNSEVSWAFLWVSAAVLLVAGNVICWTSSRAWAMWSSFVFFALFVVVRYFWLDEAFLYYKKTKGLFDGSFSLGPFFAVFLIVITAMIVFFDQFIVIRLNRKMYPPAPITKTDETGESIP